MKCGVCGKEHALLEPAFRRPDVVAGMSAKDRKALVTENEDLCEVRSRSADVPPRFFVRATLAVPRTDDPKPMAWGLWAEVDGEAFERIVERWQDPDQADEPPMRAWLANDIPGYAPTLGLAVSLRLKAPPGRPALSFGEAEHHPFAVECRRGVSAHRVAEWLHSFGPASN
jgi:hypothetical protein